MGTLKRLFTRKRLLIAGAALLPLAAFLAYLFWPRADELARWKAEMHACGENFSFTELAPKFSADKSNFVKQLRAAVDRVVTQPVAPGTLGMMEGTAPGYAAVGWRQPFAGALGRTNIPWAALAAQMTNSADALRSLRELLRNIPPGSPCDSSDPRNSGGGDILALQKSAKALALAVVNDLHRGALDDALENLHALIALARLHEAEGYLIYQMIRTAIAGIALSATWEALLAPGWDDARLAALDAAWAKVELLKHMAPAFNMERAWIVALYDVARTNTGGRSQVMGGGSGGLAQFFEDNVHGPLWQKAWSKTDELLFLRAAQPVAEAIRQGVTNRSWQLMNLRLNDPQNLNLKEMTTVDRIRYPFAGIAVPSWNKGLKTLMRQESHIQMARAAIAIERHLLKHGRVPESLAPLVPGFLPAPPVDHMTGRPLLYARNPDGSFALYSAGENGRDDDGLGDDDVWPQPGLPARVTPPAGPVVSQIIISNVPPRDALLNLARQAGLTVQFQPKFDEQNTGAFSLDLRDCTVAEALETALQRLRLSLVRGPKHHTTCVVTNLFVEPRINAEKRR